MGRRQLGGVEAISAALDSRSPISLLLLRQGFRSRAVDALAKRAEKLGIPIRFESAREMTRMSADGATAEVLALAGPPPARDLEEMMAGPGVVFCLVGLRYPGNVGYILRCVEVAGGGGVVLESDWQHEQREEALRVGMRADRFLGVLYEKTPRVLDSARRAGRRVVAVETSGGARPWDVDLSRPLVVVIGSESSGIPSAILERVDEVVRIPVGGFIPSYNVQAAVGILIGEWLRQNA